MLLSIFSTLYEALIGENAENPEFRDHLFSSVGLFTLLTAAAICFVFYILLGRWKSVWYTKAHWGITVLLCGIAGFTLAFVLTKNDLGDWDSYIIRFALFNALFAAIYFVIFSFLLKPFSIFSKRTPV